MCTDFQILGWGLIILVIILFLALCIWSNILRDTVNPTTFLKAAQDPKYNGKYKDKTADEIPRPFSLSRVQFGLWTVVISCSYIYLVFCHGCFSLIELNKTALILMGITTATAVAAGTIDASQVSSVRHQDEPSVRFLIDILSDENGISIHRFQNVVWTIIAISLYLCCLSSSSCKLPDLDSTLIVLTGISSTAYVGLKINENKP
jgi:hypothetical protein